MPLWYLFGMNAVTPLERPTAIKLTIADYELLNRSGALGNYGKSQLIEGVIVALSPQLRAHVYAKNELAYRLRRAAETANTGVAVLVEGTVELPPNNLPDPDICLTDQPQGAGYIPAESIKLIVEVSDSSLKIDLTTKADLYAGHAIPEYWVVDLPNRTIHQFWSPTVEGFSEQRTVAFGHRVEAATLEWLRVETTGFA